MPLYLTRNADGWYELTATDPEKIGCNKAVSSIPPDLFEGICDVRLERFGAHQQVEVRLVPSSPPSVPVDVLEAAKELSEDMKSAPEFFRSSDRWVQEMRKLIGFIESLAAGGEVGK